MFLTSILFILIHSHEAKVRESKSYILPWSEVEVCPIHALTTGSQGTIQTEQPLRVINIDTANVKNDTAAIKWLGPHRIDMGDRSVLLDLKAMAGLKVCLSCQVTIRPVSKGGGAKALPHLPKVSKMVHDFGPRCPKLSTILDIFCQKKSTFAQKACERVHFLPKSKQKSPLSPQKSM